MSTEQQTFTATDPVIVAVTQEMLDGRGFGPSNFQPRMWRMDIREALPAALATLARSRELLRHASDGRVGHELYEALRAQNVTVTDPADNLAEPLGAYLRSKVVLLEGKPGGTLPYPDLPGGALAGHTTHMERLRAWADNTEDDLRDSVDGQAAYLQGISVWPNDGCQTYAEAKDFLGRVMDYKASRLAPMKPVTGMRLRVDERLNRGAYFVLGSVIEVADASEERGYYGARGTTHYEGGGGQVDDMQSLFVEELRQYHLLPPDTPVGVPESSGPEPEDEDTSEPLTIGQAVDEVEAVPEVVARLNAQITELTSTVANLTERLDRATRLQQVEAESHRADVQTIGDYLIEQANNRGWCSDYDRLINDLNDSLQVELPVRTREVEVTVSGYVRVPFSITVTVEQTSEDTDVEDRAGEMVQENYSASTLLRNNIDATAAELEDDFEYEQE